MNYKWLYKRFFSMLVNPAKTWAQISDEGKEVDVLISYVYPCIGMSGLISFISSFITTIGSGLTPYEIFREALINSCVTCIPLFAVFFICIYVMNKIAEPLFGLKCVMLSLYKIVGYSMTVLFLSYAILSFPFDFMILIWLAQVYTLFLIWEGCGRLFELDDNKKLIFTVVLFLTMVIGAGILYFIFCKLI